MRKTTVVATFVFLAAVLLAFACAFGSVVSEDSWLTVAALPEPYNGSLRVVVLEGEIYFFGKGMSERYDPDANTWTAIAPIPSYSGWSAVASCQNKIYVVGSPTQVYDPLTDTWENKASLPASIFGFKANVVDDKIYVISGGKPAPLGILDTSDANFVYDPTTDSWSTMASIPAPVVGYASAVLDNKIYIIGGGLATWTVNESASLVQIFNPRTNQWTTGNHLPTGVFGAGACSTSGVLAPKRIYVVGGRLIYSPGADSSSRVNRGTKLNQVYDLETGEWSLAASIPESRVSLTLINVDDALYALGGVNDGTIYSQDNVQAVEVYIPAGYKGTLFTTITSPTASPSASPTYTNTPPSASPTYTNTPPSASPTYTNTPPSASPTYTNTPPSASPTYTNTPPSASPTPTNDGFGTNLFQIVLIVLAIAIVFIAGLAVYCKKFKRSN